MRRKKERKKKEKRKQRKQQKTHKEKRDRERERSARRSANLIARPPGFALRSPFLPSFPPAVLLSSFRRIFALDYSRRRNVSFDLRRRSDRAMDSSADSLAGTCCGIIS